MPELYNFIWYLVILSWSLAALVAVGVTYYLQRG